MIDTKELVKHIFCYKTMDSTATDLEKSPNYVKLANAYSFYFILKGQRIFVVSEGNDKFSCIYDKNNFTYRLTKDYKFSNKKKDKGIFYLEDILENLNLCQKVKK